MNISKYNNIIRKYISETKNPHLKLFRNYKNLIIELLRAKSKDLGRPIQLLDIGGGKGWGKILYERDFIKYHVLDLKCSKMDNNVTFIKGDITETIDIEKTFDVIFTKDTFEHILNPWNATDNILQLLKENGLFIFMAPFSWRYHASPFDAYRYSHTGTRYLFERYGGLYHIKSGYIKFAPKTGFWKNRKDITMDGKPFTSCLETIYIAVRKKGHEFNIEDLDVDNSWNHSK